MVQAHHPDADVRIPNGIARSGMSEPIRKLKVVPHRYRVTSGFHRPRDIEPISSELIQASRAMYTLSWRGTHGILHWARV